MEIVVFHSDIARLVLAYLKNQRLEKASRIFCKTSPHLRQEYTAFKQGLQAYSFFPELEEIIREYVKITRKVEQVVAALPEILQPKFQHKKLSQKLNEFLDRSLSVIIAQCGGGSGGAGTRGDCKPTNNSTASCSSVQSDKENKAKKHSDCKRKRNFDTTNTSHERSTKNETPKKRRRVLEPFCFLTVTRQKPRRNSPTSSIEHMLSTENDEKNHDQTTDSQEELEDETDVSTDDDDEDIIDNAEDNEDVSILEKPTKESTPRAKTAAPTLSEFSQAILDNPEFQQKLVENINQALQTSDCLLKESVDTLKECSTEVHVSARKTRSSTSQASKLESTESEASLATSSQLLDQLVKDILANTEKDPTFDAIIQDVVGASTSKLNVCERNNVDNTTLATVHASNGIDNISSISTVPPSTPLLVRTLPTNATSHNGDPQALTTLTANNSFGSLIDPNFSISKLIVLNSNDSAQKNQNDPTLGNTTADNLLNQLASQSVASIGGSELTNIDDQVYFDVNTGQLTLPLFLTNDGLLTNFPFLINNELITQQLQPDNIANLDTARIEIPLPEPISFSADQLPPNSIIVGSTQKSEAAEGLQRTVCKLQKNASVVPASLDSRITIERSTPSTNGIINAKAFKSLSTPRKRASHVRTLTFSPRSSFMPHTTPLSTRRESVSRFQRAQKTMPINLGQTIASNVETQLTIPPNPDVEKIKNTALQSIAKVTTVAATVAESSANDSSNSCSVPPLFAMEESSNQTVIKANLPSDPETKIKKPEPKIKLVAETPKRKQLRKTAVRACKRVLSKSAAEEQHATAIKQQEENSKTEESDLNCSKQSDEKPEHEVGLAEEIKQKKDRMMEEWVRMRTATKNDLDSRLREWNSKMMHTRPNQKCVKKLRKKRGRSLAAIAAKAKANQSLEEEKTQSTESNKVETEALNNKQTDTSGNAGSGKESQNETQVKEKPKTKQIKKSGKTKGKAKDSNSSAEFNIKITTPQKAASSTEVLKKDERIEAKLEKAKRQEEKQDSSPATVDEANQASVLNSSNETSWSLPTNNNATKTPAPPPSTQKHSESLELEKRTANIACLLETPFKDPISSNSLTAACVPPTPGVFGTTFETPLSKLKPTTDDLLSHSFLFGSLTKSELETPLLSAITPGGFKFTPFGSKEATPRSVAATEYSSGGGSYYRPDESDDLDRNIDKLLRDSAQKKTANTPEKVEPKTPPKFEITSANEVEKSKNLEITAEKLKVEPIVLKRVKSFGSEAVDNAVDALANIDPHYTLATGLPEVSDDEASSSSSSSSATSSSSSSSSSSSGTSSASSRSSSLKSNYEKNSETVIERNDGRQSLNVSLALDNLSEISSTEDDEWQKLVVSDDENSQLVDHQGEVRYPVRSWLTPNKAATHMATAATTTTTATKTGAEPVISNPIKVKLPIKVSEKRNKHLSELEEKRQRMKSKLKNDNQHKDRVLQSSSAAAVSATRRLQLAKEMKLKKMQQQQTPQEKRQPNEETKLCTIDVLTALNLSAKKRPPVGAKELRPLEVVKLQPLGDVDDNAVSNVFDSALSVKQSFKHAINTGNLETPKTQTLQTPVKPKQTTMTKQRKCLQIEPRPVGTPRGAKGKVPKKAPVRAKAEASLLPSDSAEAEVIPTAAPKPSPVPKIKIKSSVAVNVNRQKTNTFYGTKSTNKNNRDDEVSTEKTSKPIISRKLNKTPIKKPGAKLLQKQTASSNKNQQVKQQKNVEETKELTAPRLETQSKDTVDALTKMTTEQKVVKPHVNPTEHKESATITPKMSPVVESNAEQKLAPVPAPVSHSCTAQPVNEEDEDISEDDDPLKYCTLASYAEDDCKGHFITLKYKGIDGEAPKQSNTIYDLSNFRMVIAFDEDEQHTLQVSEEYCLYESKPKQQQQQLTKTQSTVRNIPKKRRLRVATTSTSDDSVESTLLSTKATKSFAKSSPAASSTPMSATTAVTEIHTTSDKATKMVVAASKEDKTTKTLSVKSTTNSQAIEKPSTSLAPSLNSAAAEKIQIEDIESILSHLHGT